MVGFRLKPVASLSFPVKRGDFEIMISKNWGILGHFCIKLTEIEAKKAFIGAFWCFLG